MRTALQLRCLVRACEARVLHLSACIRDGDFPAPFHFRARLEQAHADLALYRGQLAALTSPAAPATHQADCGSLVTSCAAQPAPVFPNV